MPRSRASGPKGPSQRQLRIGEHLRHELAALLARGDIRDPALAGVSVTVTEVTVSPDLKAATVFCTPLGGRRVDDVIDALNRHRSFLRGALGHRLTLRYTPTLTFAHDASFDRAEAMDALIRAATSTRRSSSDEGHGP